MNISTCNPLAFAKQLSVNEKKPNITFIGVGSAFAKKNNQSSFFICKNGKSLLVDIGTTIPMALHSKGIGLHEFDYYHITHSHADHMGGVEELGFMGRYVHKTKPKMLITETYQRQLWDSSLAGSMAYTEEGLLKFTDYFEVIRPEWVKKAPREMFTFDILDMDMQMTIFRTAHIPGFTESWEKSFWCNGVLIDSRIMVSGDTRFDLSLFDDVGNKNLDAVFHDTQLFNPGSVHATYDQLKTLPNDLKQKMYLYHYGDNYTLFNPKSDGFAGFAQQWEIYS